MAVGFPHWSLEIIWNIWAYYIINEYKWFIRHPQVKLCKSPCSSGRRSPENPGGERPCVRFAKRRMPPNGDNPVGNAMIHHDLWGVSHFQSSSQKKSRILFLLLRESSCSHDLPIISTSFPHGTKPFQRWAPHPDQRSLGAAKTNPHIWGNKKSLHTDIFQTTNSWYMYI